MDPHALTLRELYAMADGRVREAWNHTSQLMCLTANINRDPKRKPKPYAPADFHAMERAREVRPIPADISVLRDVFVKPHERTR